MAAIYWGSSRSTLPGPWGSREPWSNALGMATHVGEYAILSALTHRALRQHSSRFTVRPAPDGTFHASRLIVHPAPDGTHHVSSFIPRQTGRFTLHSSLALTMLFALTDEWHQSFVPGRQFDLRDLALDLVGVVAALSIQKTGIGNKIKNRGLRTKD